MSITYPTPSEGVNPLPQPKPSYWAVIPASVRYCKLLPPAAKLLFGEITALCSVEGFCWASNSYFCDLYEVDRSTLKRWLAALAKEGFVRVDLVPGTGERRIYDLTIKHPDPAQKRDGGGAKMSRTRRKSEPHSNTKINTKNNSETLNVVGGSALIFAGPGPLPAGELQKQEEKGPSSTATKNLISASPMSLESWKDSKINAVVAVTDDDASRKRFLQLLDLCDKAACVDLWDNALDALKTRLGASTEPVACPGAYFCSMLVTALNGRGVAVPVGTPSQRRSVRSMITSSLASSDQACGDLPQLVAGEVQR